jgi:Kef-type K+ transport system membrane component KefB
MVRDMSADSVTAIVIADIGLVLGLSSLLGAAAQRLGQPKVIGQILTGIALGPSLLGHLPGHLTGRLFPAAALPYLSVLSQVGVVVFMFLVGYEIDFRAIGGRTRPVLLVVLGALVIPMALGSGSAVLFRGWFAGAGQQSGHSFVLFIGVAVAVTALPVLASIVRERGLADTTAGVVATSAAGGMDVLAWIALAAAVAGATHAAHRPWALTALLICLWAAAMMLIVRPVLRMWFNRPAAFLTQQVTTAAVLTMASAYVTTLLGLHPVFGGFLAGLTMSRVSDRGRDPDVLRAMESASDLLLPLFFVNTGLVLNIGSLRPADLGLLALIIAIACGGKLVPGYFGARLGGLTKSQSATVAALVNTRGLTELIALNTGLQAGILNRRLFTIFVLMALLTTMATGPLLTLIGRRSADSPAQDVQPDEAEQAEHVEHEPDKAEYPDN